MIEPRQLPQQTLDRCAQSGRHPTPILRCRKHTEPSPRAPNWRARRVSAACGPRVSPCPPLALCLLHQRRMGRTLAALLLLVTATVGPAAAAAGERARAPASTGGDSCRKLPEGKRLRLNLKPNTEPHRPRLVDLGDHVQALHRAGVDPVAGQDGHDHRAAADHRRRGLRPVSRRARLGRADRLPDLRFLRVIETSRIKSAPIPIVIDGQD